MQFGIIIRKPVVEGMCAHTEVIHEVVSDYELMDRMKALLVEPICRVEIYSEDDFEEFCEVADYEPEVCEQYG